LENLIKKAIVESPLNLKENAPLADENVCKTFVVAVASPASGVPVLLRTYGTTTADAFDAKTWEAALATSADPTFFEPVLINGVPYVGAGRRRNNPTAQAITEAQKLWPERAIGCLLSIGTGLENAIQLSDWSGSESYSWFVDALAPKGSYGLDVVANYCVDSLTSCEKIHHDVCSELPGRIVVDQNYFRWNVPRVLSAIGVEEWKKIVDVVELTNEYMKQGHVKYRKLAVARLLLNPQTAG
jgi:hypothetical protein